MAGMGGSQKVLDSKEYAAVSKWVSGQTKVVGEALDAFCEPVEDKYFNTQNSSDVEGLLWTTWQGVVGEAATIPHTSQHRQRLVEFMVNLAHRPTLTKGDHVCEVENLTVWRDLPVFGWQLREAWNFAASSNSDQTSKEHWVNINAFTASLVSSLHSHAQDRPDYSLFAIWTLRTGLEETGEVPDVSLAAAAVWLLYSAPTLWAYSKQEKSFEGKVARAGSSFSAESWTGFSKLRWQAWKQNLQDTQRPASDQGTAELVKHALQAMQDAEQQ